MQHIYMQSNEHFEVFTTVLAPQAGRNRYKAEAEKMVVVHSYRPHWPDELFLAPGDVIMVVSKHEEGRWFGRLQEGQWGYFPASCVMELGQSNLPTKALQRSLSLRVTSADSKQSSGHVLQALRRGSSREGGEGTGLDWRQVKREGPFLERRPQSPPPESMASQPKIRRSSSLLHRILSKCRRKSECEGAANGAFEGD
ncbi:jouberin-like [Cyprinodon tularosa]|uniref:jouberin-like n=1 Tax=Cyprinodon tularosa TaxID=77115 RepID=UPI0018E21A35|nr:jouberin-like [Cyprinodon tularosa]